MSDSDTDLDPYFVQLAVSLQAAAIQHMGKVASPISGKVERNMELARNSIDTLSMLKSKMQGNLTKDEKDFIDHLLYGLRLNYVDEIKKKDEDRTEEQPSEGDDSSPPAKEGAEARQTTADDSSGPETGQAR